MSTVKNAQYVLSPISMTAQPLEQRLSGGTVYLILVILHKVRISASVAATLTYAVRTPYYLMLRQSPTVQIKDIGGDRPMIQERI